MPRRPFSPGPASRRDPGHQRLADVFPGLWRGSTSGWLAGLGQLDDPSAASRFIASRLVYRQLGRRAWLLAVPVLLALLLRLPVALLRPARQRLRHSPGDDAGCRRRGVGASSGPRPGLVAPESGWPSPGRAGEPRDLNEAARAAGRELASTGWAGSGHGRDQPGRAEPGGHRLLRQCRLLRGRRERVPASRRRTGPAVRFPGYPSAGLDRTGDGDRTARPPPFRAGPGAGGDLGRAALDPTAGVAAAGGRGQFPQRAPWPAVPGRVVPHRRSRRLAALVVAAAGFVSLVSDLSAPVAHHLNVLRQLLPLAVPQAAGALGGTGRVGAAHAGPWDPARPTPGLPRVPGHPGRRRHIAPAGSGQRHRCRHRPGRRRFPVASPRLVPGRQRRAPGSAGPLARLVGLAVAAVVAGALALEGTSWVTTTVHHRRSARIGWVQAFQATIERMVGVKHVALPDRLDDFFSPAMFSVTAGLVLVAAWMVFRPVVARWPRHGSWRASNGPGRWSGGTAPGPSITSRCAPTRSSISGAGRSWLTPFTAASAWFRPTLWARRRSVRAPGGASASSPIPGAGAWACSGRRRTGCPSTGPRACTTCTWATRRSCARSGSRSEGASPRACAKQ